jgi:V/A-type H+-transporting ATPase subunit D
LTVELAGIHPTRQELLKLRRRKALAEGIVDILKKDLDALIVTLFDFLKEIPSTRDQLYATLIGGYHHFVRAEMVAGSLKIEEISLVARPINFNVATGVQRGILGILFPSLKLAQRPDTNAPRFNLLDSPADLDESSLKISSALEYVVKLAEKEASVRETLEVIAVKKRQINRIEYRILPQLNAAIKYIELIIEEAERQDAIRVRVLQRKRKERMSKTS